MPDDKKNISIHQLLTHSSGLEPMIGNDYENISMENSNLEKKLTNNDII